MTNGNAPDSDGASTHGIEQPAAEHVPASVGLTPEQREAIFAHRAAQLARPVSSLHATITAERAANVALVFPLAGEHYAFAGASVREVRPLGEVTPLPGTPAFVAGLMNVRGRIVPLLDLRLFFGLPAAPSDTGGETVVILGSPRGDVGVLTTGRPVVRVVDDSLRAMPATAPPGLQAAYVRGVTADLIVVIDAERLLADERLMVQAEV